MPEINNTDCNYPNSSFIGLGSNEGDREQYLSIGKLALTRLPQTHLVNYSSVYQSKPMGPQNQPDFFNSVAELKTQLGPLQLLQQLQAIETECNRQRSGERWGPRTLDLDILLHQNTCIDLPHLVVPHYGIAERNFVLLPLFEIAPDLCFPDGTKLFDRVKSISSTGIEKLS